jgi:hypothetical protein
VVAAHQVQPAGEQRYQVFDHFPLAQRQVSNKEDNLFWLDKAVPVFDDRFLPAIRTVAIAPDVRVEEMGGCRSGDDPGLVIKGELWLGQ